MTLWHTLLYQPFVNALIFLYQLFGNFGLAIIVLTATIRLLLIPLTLPSMKAVRKMSELAPELEKLKRKYKKDKQALAKAQMELYRQHGANPAAGCLPQIIQLVILVALYQAFNQVLRADGEIIEKLNQVLYSSLQLPLETKIDLNFLWLELNKPDLIRLSGVPVSLPGIFLVTAAITQFLSSKLLRPSVMAAQKQAEKTPAKSDDMAAAMQNQMLYLFPIMTVMIGYSFPSGLVLYWLTFSVFTAVQQWLLNKGKVPRKEGLKNG